MPTEPPPGAGPTGHYFDRSPAAATDRRSVWLNVPGAAAQLSTDRGVFSGAGIDPGTRLLLQERPTEPAGGDDDHLLDLGCGYGPITVALALWTRREAVGPAGPADGDARRGPTIWAVDVNDRALDLCRENVAAAGVADRVRVIRPEEAPEGVRFRQIWSNPPIRIGKTALHDLLRTWLARLDQDGEALLVVQKHLGADSLAAWLATEGHAVRRCASRMGYRLLAVTAR